MRKLLVVTTLALATAPAVQAGRAGWFITGYCLRGTTATGEYVHEGVVAVDPAYIPLHARVWIDGRGPYRALDTGVYGHHVDVWVRRCADAYRLTRHGARVWWRR